MTTSFVGKELTRILKTPRNNVEASFKRGWISVTKGITVWSPYTNPKNKDYKNYLAGRKAARQFIRNQEGQR